jgi:hypothetical protein
MANYKIISFGHRCLSANIIKCLGLKYESYPFDWLVSKLDVIQDCIETNFAHFLNVDNYVKKEIETNNIIDGKVYKIYNGIEQINIYYDKNNNNNSLYLCKLAINHRHINEIDNYKYYERCIKRLYELLDSNIKKYYIYIHPIIGINEYENEKDNILKIFDDFSEFIIKKTNNIFGFFFIFIKCNKIFKSLTINKNLHYSIYIIYCNEKYIDGKTFESEEKDEVVNILKEHLIE